MTVEARLKELVSIHFQLDSEKQIYTVNRNQSSTRSLAKDFAKLINQELLRDGVEDYHLSARLNQLIPFFDPDNQSNFVSEVTLINAHLSEDPSVIDEARGVMNEPASNKGACYTILHLCYQKMVQPTQFKEMSLYDIKTSEELHHWVQRAKSKTTSKSKLQLFDSVLDLLAQSNQYYDNTGRLKPQALKSLISSIPLLFTAYTAVIVAEELFLIYAAFFLALKGGQYLANTNYKPLKKLGRTLQNMGSVSTYTATILLVHFIRLIFLGSGQGLQMTLNIGQRILPSGSKVTEQQAKIIENLANDLINASKDLIPGKKFNTPELKVISSLFETYLVTNQQQWLRLYRSTTKHKAAKVILFLHRLESIDQQSISLEEQLGQVKAELSYLKNNNSVYNSGVADTVQQAEKILVLLNTSTFLGQAPTEELVADEELPPSLDLTTHAVSIS